MDKFNPEYHKDVDVGFFEINTGKYERSAFPSETLIYDLDSKGKLLAIEILGFSKGNYREALADSVGEFLEEQEIGELLEKIEAENEKVS